MQERDAAKRCNRQSKGLCQGHTITRDVGGKATTTEFTDAVIGAMA